MHLPLPLPLPLTCPGICPCQAHAPDHSMSCPGNCPAYAFARQLPLYMPITGSCLRLLHLSVLA